ncbi:MAG: zinc ribbon domain-containing protein [Leptospiraceae bacterium]|nr:zinc ribbon domain-containing protein [Leptospiraceae bacterium]
MKCPNCAAPISDNSLKCQYCGTVLQNQNNFGSLEPLEFAIYLKDYIEKVRGKYDLQIFSSLFVIVIIWLGLGYILYSAYSLVWFIFFTILEGCILFIGWGGIIQYYENKAIDEVFDSELAPLLKSYLIQKNFSQQELYLRLKKQGADPTILKLSQKLK